MGSEAKLNSPRSRLLLHLRRHRVGFVLSIGFLTFLLFVGGHKFKISHKNYEITVSDVMIESEQSEFNELEAEILSEDTYQSEDSDTSSDEEETLPKISLFEEMPSTPNELKYLPIPAQIVPKTLNTVVNYRTKQCTYFCQLVLSLGYETKKSMSLYPKSNPPELLLINFKKYPFYSNMAHTIVNMIGRGSSCIGGGKGRQLWCHETLASSNGCDFNDFKIQPKQTNIQQPKNCKEFFEFEKLKNEEKIYIAKPGGSYHGKGITIHDNLDEMKAKFGNCKKILNDGIIIQDYIKSPMLLEGHKFDFRSYLLIASTDPFLVFYSNGFIRKASSKYTTDSQSLKDPLAHVTNDVKQSSENHFYSFEQLEEKTAFRIKEFIPYSMRVTNYLFHTARMGYKNKGIIPTKGRYQLFALDWMIDSEGAFHLLEGNGNPLITHYEGIDLTPELWTSMMELIRKIHVTPEEFEESLSVEEGYEYKKWKLVYNELEVNEKDEEYQPCRFQEYADTNHSLYSYKHFV